MKRAAIYVRGSPASKSEKGDAVKIIQDLKGQEQLLDELVAERGWTLYRIYFDSSIRRKEKRPGYDALISDARQKLFDVVLVWRFDRFARSLRQFVFALEEFRTLGINFISHQEAIDTTTPMGKAMSTIITPMAELERSIIRDRAVSSLDRVRRNGTRSGRAVGRPRAIFDRDQVVELRNQGKAWRAIARECGAGVTTVRRAHQAITTTSV